MAGKETARGRVRNESLEREEKRDRREEREKSYQNLGFALHSLLALLSSFLTEGIELMRSLGYFNCLLRGGGFS